MKNNKFDEYFNQLITVIHNHELIKLTLSSKIDKKSELKNVNVTMVQLKKGFFLNFVYRYNTKDVTKNYSFDEGVKFLQNELENNFYNAHLYSTTEDFFMQRNPAGKVILKKNAPSMQLPESFHHDNVKDRLIKSQKNIYLRELGIVNANWEIRREMQFKYKQINKYIELLSPYLTNDLFENACKIVDMGSGKGYLTFALYDYITSVLQKEIQMIGVEMRPDLVDSCNAIAEKCGFTHLNFVTSTIKEVQLDKIDVLIALHACNTATDDSIYRGITSDAQLIVCAPCCHKQVRKVMNPTNSLKHIAQYGILKEHQAELLTDGIRAMLLEAFGYKTNVFQFIETEHTPKNVMIVGEKIANPKNKAYLLSEINNIKEMFGIENHYLETLLLQ